MLQTFENFYESFHLKSSSLAKLLLPTTESLKLMLTTVSGNASNCNKVVYVISPFDAKVFWPEPNRAKN